jgi:hypothetical protein
VYDAYYELEEVVEMSGLVDEIAMLVGGSNASHAMNVEDRSPRKKAKTGDADQEKT